MRIGKIVKRIAAGLGITLLILSIIYWDLTIYGIRQGTGQLNIVWNARPVQEFLDDPGYPDSLKSKLQLIGKVRSYAIQQLGLNDTENYKTMYDQHGEEVLWVVTASQPFRLEAKEWTFPVLGAVPYKGFFRKDLAMEERDKLLQEGFDTSVRNPGAWSTLGWFTDPILSGMLERSDGDLASLIIHEMVHATIFVKDSVEFNENLASFIGDRGAEMFLKDTFGENSEAYTSFVTENVEYYAYVSHILRACSYLDAVYDSIADLSLEQKRVRKEAAIRRVLTRADTLTFSAFQNPANRYKENIPNNAYFLSFRRYQSRQDDFWELWRNRFQSDLLLMIEYMKESHPFL